ncbi:MAG: flagellar protein FlgN [Anaeromicrobium sp.]|jgi:conjugal transfer/entry exclusion protein|uniref:flagellar protein FlgN n=1 Tax=Anaeromicrobium sp. TaxID=1929132 RepID=UPI0025F7CC47|nr:flagellar protein FlgN [Anaeromicrobium sp.]MCT4592709.1 flagellar protein FlgN [Anaeromicrobium sp.]
MNKINELINICDNKLELLKKMLQMTKNQNHIVLTTDMGKLTNNIKEKQKIIDKINELDMEFLKVFNEVKTLLNVKSMEEISLTQYPQFVEVKTRIEKIMEYLEDIKKIDDENTLLVENEFNELKKKMKNVKVQQSSRKIASAYNKKYASVSGVFLDNNN